MGNYAKTGIYYADRASTVLQVLKFFAGLCMEYCRHALTGGDCYRVGGSIQVAYLQELSG